MRKIVFRRILPAVLIIVAVLEIGSKLILNTIQSGYRYGLEPNRFISGHYVFKNRPGYTFSNTFKTSPEDPNIHFDEFGFIKHFDGYEKDSSIYRIFLCGGSAMLGAGQTCCIGYEDVYEYTHNIYSYPSSIAGRLQKKLQAKYPSQKIQVINTASYMRPFHHSHILYLETITHLEPDLVISMDGYNDLGALGNSRNPYYFSEQDMLPQYLELYYHTERRGVSNFMNLVNYVTKNMAIEPPDGKDSILESINPALMKGTYSTYFFEKEMLKFCGDVKDDSAQYLFVFQPVLSFATGQKLSARELGFKVLCDKQLSSLPSAGEVNSSFDAMGLKLAGKGGYYLNANTVPAHSGEGEMFTDYCHFTAWGNDRLANLIYEKIVSEGLVQ